MFIDEVVLQLKGGQGGNGVVSFHREKFVSHGPPDGGDGGNGGHIIVRTNVNLNTFKHFSGRKHFSGDRGGAGHKNNCHGKNGEDLILEVPVGTLIYDNVTGDVLHDLNEENQEVVIAKGGRGGYGNAHFVSSVRQAPDFSELGDIGQERDFRFELQLLADVGLLGFPSAGKSTLISHMSSAKPKIGAYPFTTLIPNLGVVFLGDFGGSQDQSFVLADMPGIIEGASEGKGLGHRFLKHIARSALLVYVLDPFSDDQENIVEQYRVLKNELITYKESLAEKAVFVAMNKIDAIPHDDREEIKTEFLKEFPELKDSFFLISGVSGEGLDPFAFALWNAVQAAGELERSEDDDEAEEAEDDEVRKIIVPSFFVEDQHFQIEKAYEFDIDSFEPFLLHQLIKNESKPKRFLYVVTGRRIEQISRMTNVTQEGGVHRVYDVLKKMGIHDALRREGASTGDVIKVGPHFYEYHDLEV